MTTRSMKRATARLGVVMLEVGAITSVVGWATRAAAQTEPYFRETVRAPSHAFELALGAGYVQSYGQVTPGIGNAILHIAGAGVGAGVSADYRFVPWVSAGVEAEYSQFDIGNNASARGLGVSIGATAHAMPYGRGDPWLRLGAGYHALYDVNAVGILGQRTNTFQGLDVATAKVGYDVRVKEDVAFAPVIGADVQLLLWENAVALPKAQVGAHVYAGVQGRFDVGGSYADHR